MTSPKKVFGIISYFPDNDTPYHIETRKERSRRFRELLFKLDELWPEVDILIIAQNWQDFQLPEIHNKITVMHYNKLGILGARKELRRRFLISEYDYLIMLDDDFIVEANDPQAYMVAIDEHPNGFGALKRYPPSPLPFFAISKHIYSQIDMPDIDPEKGEGFEDDVFAAQCFARFGDKSFIFPEGCVADRSFHYDGPGKCPSTWSREKKYNWNYMRSHTKDEIMAIENLVCEEDTEEVEPTSAPIDLIIPYVNGSDSLWVKDYIRVTRQHKPSSQRFRSWGTLKYLFRGVAKYMPFINQIVLIVARPSQVPVWVNPETVRIVYHDEFIPKEFLPTFNSCTIESYLWNIPDLADRVIYFNDDMFPVAKMREEDFFTENTPHIKFTDLEVFSDRQIFRSQCRSGLDLITNVLNLPPFEEGKIIRPYHTASAFTKASFEKVRDLCQDKLPSTVSNLRTIKNVNQYIYSYYLYFTDNYVDEIVDYKYFEMSDKTFDNALKEILSGNHKMLCLNDSDKIKDYARTRYRLNECFEKKFPNRSKYEM